MSLYVGHLSSNVRQEELERVFQRFGRCNVRLKDRYGFVVYENAADAGRALQNLRGKNICGENIFLNWANKQPRHAQRLASTGRHQGSIKRTLREDNGVRLRASPGLRNFRSASHSSMHKDEEHQLNDEFLKESSDIPKDIIDIEECNDLNLDNGLNEGISSGVNQEDSGRWGQPSNDTMNGCALEDGSGFDRYEPYQGYGRDDVENTEMDVTYHHQERKNSKEKRWKEKSSDDTFRNVDKSKSQQVCYKCEQVGNLMCSCPNAEAQREKISSFGYKQKESSIRERREGWLKTRRADSLGKRNGNIDPITSMRLRRNRMEFYSKRNARAGSKIANVSERSERHRLKFMAGSPTKQKVKWATGGPKKEHRKVRTRDSTSTSSLSPRTVSRSRSRSRSRLQKSDSESSSPPRGRRLSSISQSSFSSSSSSSLSSHSKSVSSRSTSRSQSISMPSSLSLSVSIKHETEPSPKLTQMEIGSVASSKKVVCLEPSVQLETNSMILGDECRGASFKLDAEPTKEYPKQNVDNSQFGNVRVEGSESYLGTDLHREVSAQENHEGKAQQKKSTLTLKKNMTTERETIKPTRLGMEELFSVLKHYGLGTPAEWQSNITVGEYFGAARLWPWEVIYYRQMKKGPISTENYARRVEQNKEFGIIDKYIRSSSGWGEENEDVYT